MNQAKTMYAEKSVPHNLDQELESEDRGYRAELQSYTPLSPFLAEESYKNVNSLVAEPVAFQDDEQNGNSMESIALHSPFISEYSLPGLTMESTESLLYREVLHDIVDQEFNEAMDDLVNELREIRENNFEGQTFESSQQAERYLASYLHPLQEGIENTLDRMITESAPFDNESITELQLDNFLESFDYEKNYVEPQFEDFFKKLFKKVKKIAKKGVRIARKVGKTLGKFSPVHMILRKVKKLAKPLLTRVLKFALNKIPSRYRPLAKKLARRFLKGRLGRFENEQTFNHIMLLEDQVTQSAALMMDQGMASISSESIGADFDAMIAGYLMEGQDFEYDPAAMEFFSDEQYQGVGSVDDLELARNQFINAMLELEDDDDPQVPIENFVTAILTALRIGIKIIGRKRVVNFLAKQVARLIRRYVGRSAARPLSRALVDAGMKLVNLESEGEQSYAAAEVIAATVEGAIEKLAELAPAQAFDDESELAIYAQEALQEAVVENFPPSLIRDELRIRRRDKGMWILRPAGRRRKKYKKYSHPINVTVTPGVAAKVKTFGGRSLKGFLKEQLGLDTERQPVQATLHMFKAMRGTTMPEVSRFESEIQGLGSGDRSSWMQFHPLTDEAVTLLAPDHDSSEVKVNARHLIDHDRIAVGQRFYYLEIPGARVMTIPQSPDNGAASKNIPVRASETNLNLDFANNRILIFSYLSEARSSEMAGHLRKGRPINDLISEIRKSLDHDLAEILNNASTPQLQLRRAQQSSDNLLSIVVPMLKSNGRSLGKIITQFVVRSLVTQVRNKEKEFSSHFVEATNDPADGVTLKFSLTQADDFFALLSGSVNAREQALAKLLEGGLSGSFSRAILPGFKRT